MIHELLNTLYVQTQGAYAHLDHETVRLQIPDAEDFQVPLHHLGGLAVFGNVLVSPFLVERCGEDGRSLVWFSRSGRFRGRLAGPTTGNVFLRRAQHEAMANPGQTLHLAKQFTTGKVRNARQVLLRAHREAEDDDQRLLPRIEELRQHIERIATADSIEVLRGIEGNAAVTYFEAFDALVKVQEPAFRFEGRSRRPPLDPINSLLSFAYSLTTNDCAAALEGVGLDPQMGFLHVLRPGRPALALDLVEEFRAWIADRAVLALINRRQLQKQHFDVRPGGAVEMTEEGRKLFLKNWQERKQEEIEHPVLKTRMPIGLLPHVQARILARYLRGDIAEYIPFVAR